MSSDIRVEINSASLCMMDSLMSNARVKQLN